MNNFHKGVRVGKPLIPLTALIRTEDSGKWVRLREIAEVVAAR